MDRLIELDMLDVCFFLFIYTFLRLFDLTFFKLEG